MHSSNLILPPTEGEDTRTQEQRDLWAAAAPRIDRMLPGFLAEALAPAPPPRVSASAEHKSESVSVEREEQQVEAGATEVA
jgi:brefeldin A-resistance guanine nucleotide exchange factor 1